LIFRKIIKIVIRCHILKQKCTKFDFGWGSTPDPAGEAYSTPPDPLAGYEGLGKGKKNEREGQGRGEGRGRRKASGERGREGSRKEERRVSPPNLKTKLHPCVQLNVRFSNMRPAELHRYWHFNLGVQAKLA